MGEGRFRSQESQAGVLAVALTRCPDGEAPMGTAIVEKLTGRDRAISHRGTKSGLCEWILRTVGVAWRVSIVHLNVMICTRPWSW